MSTLLTTVKVSQLSATLRDIVAIWRAAGEPIDQNGEILIEAKHKGLPRKARRVFDSAYNAYDANTPLPLVPVKFK